MLKLYGIAASQASRCLWALEELGLDYQLIPVPPYTASRSDEHLLRNPNGRVPVLEDGALLLWESIAINLHLAQVAGAPLWPETAADRGRCLQWSLWAVTEFEPHLQRLWVHGDESARAPLEAALALLNRELERAGWLVGNGFSIADLNVESYVIRARRAQCNLGTWPGIAGWVERCEARPARRAVRAMIDAETASQNPGR